MKMTPQKNQSLAEIPGNAPQEQTRRVSASRARNRVLVMAALSFGATFGAIANAQNANAAETKASEPRVYSTDVVNIAAADNGGRVIDTTSVFNNDTAFGANNLIDGKIYDPASKNSSNGWVSNKYDSINMESVTLGFADNALKNIGKIVINPNAGVAPERWAKDIEVQVSTTSPQGPYRPIAQLTLKRSATNQEFIVLPTPARFVRLVMRSNWGSDRAVALGEVEIYEGIGTDDANGALISRLESAINDLKRFRDAQNEVNNATSRSVSTYINLARTTKISAQIGAVAATKNTTSVAAAAAPLPPVADASSTRSAEIAPAPIANGRATNIAAAANGGKIVASSSLFNNDAKYSPDNLIDGQNYSLSDGKNSFGWASEGFTSGQQSVTIGFRDDRTHVISKFVINPTSNQNSLRWASRIEVQVTNGSPTDGPFRTVSTLTVRQEAVNQDFSIQPVEAKYVRFVFVANGPGNPLPQGDPNVSSDRAVSLGEIEIYEPAASTGELDSLIGRFAQVLLDMKRLRSEQQADR